MTPHVDRAHATLAPSSAHRWLVCPGSIRMSSGIVDAGSVFAAEGTAAHELAAHCLGNDMNVAPFRGWTVGPGWLTKPEDGSPDGVTTFKVTDEMVEAVQTYLDVAYAVKAESDEFEFEQWMDMADLVPGVSGTADVKAYRRDKRRVTIIDLKYGKGVAVEVEDNEQELTYAAGVALRYHNQGVDEVELIVVQPRAPHPDGPVRRWVTDVITLYDHVAALQAAARAVDDPSAPLVAGSHCKFCKAAGFCGELYNKVKEIMGTEQAEAKPFKPWLAEAAEIALVKQWAKDREAFAHAESIRGNPPPDSKLVAKRAFRKFPDVEVAGKSLLAAGAMLDDIYEPPVLKSPAALEKVVDKIGKEIIKKLAKAESNGSVIAPLSDKRPAVDPASASGFEDQSVTHATDL